MDTATEFNPLAIDKETVEKIGADPGLELPIEQKIAYVTAQLEEFKKMQWRSRVDAVLSANLVHTSSDETVRNAAAQKRTANVMEANQFNMSIEALNHLKEQLEAQE